MNRNAHINTIPNIILIVCCSIICVAIYRFYSKAGFFGGHSLIIINSLLLFFLASFVPIFLSFKVKITAITSILSAVLALYLFDFYVFSRNGFILDEITSIEREILESRQKNVLGFTRDIKVSRERAKGNSAYMFMAPEIGNAKTPLEVNKKMIYPLTGIASQRVYFCAECEGLINYTSDRFGFRNSDSLWENPNITHLAVGDSFTQGACVSSQMTIAGIVRNKFPGTINLGVSGSGPLSQLATLREYASHKKPKTVLWFFFFNDLPNLKTESRAPVLKNYLNTDFRQNLMGLNTSLNRALIERHDQYLDQLNKKRAADKKVRKGNVQLLPKTTFRLMDFVLMRHLRYELDLIVGEQKLAGQNLDHFANVLGQAKKVVESWGGRMVFVYLPGLEEVYAERTGKGDFLYLRSSLLRAVKEMEIAHIDTTQVFAGIPVDKLSSIFCGHYTRLGTQKIGSYLVDWLSKNPAAK